MKKSEEFRSRVYTERPDYADLPSDEKFMAILGIIGTRLKQHPNVVKAAWAIFGDSYRYRQEYNAFKERMKHTKDGQLTFDDIE